jgi:hypothetical protein
MYHFVYEGIIHHGNFHLSHVRSPMIQDAYTTALLLRFEQWPMKWDADLARTRNQVFARVLKLGSLTSRECE